MCIRRFLTLLFCFMPLQRYEVDDSKTDFQDSYIGEKLNSRHVSDFKGSKNSHHQLKQKSPVLHYFNSFPREKSSLNMYEDSDGETPVYDSNQGYSFSSKHDAGWVGLDSIMNHHDSYCGKIDSEEANRLLHNNPIVSTKLVRNSDYVPKFANFTLGSSKSIDAGERGPSKKKAKVLLLHYIFVLISSVIQHYSFL